MILEKNDKAQYGLPYMGSKSKIISKIAKFFPNANHFYDLFGGGFSVSHYMIKHRSKSYSHFHYNEIRPGMCEFIQDAINGKYSYENKPEWISRERFFREKESNPYIKIIWSFGNHGTSYIFGSDIEHQKRSMHQAVVFDEFDDFMKEAFGLSKWPQGHLDITAKRLLLKRIIAKSKKFGLQQLQQLQQLERLQQLEQLQQLERLQQLDQLNFTNKDYRSVVIHPNSVIYCDIPYQGTADYGNSFSHTAFFEWAREQANPVFISEYKINEDDIFLLKEFSHRSTLSASANNLVTERLYGNKISYDLIQEKLREKKNG